MVELFSVRKLANPVLSTREYCYEHVEESFKFVPVDKLLNNYNITN